MWGMAVPSKHGSFQEMTEIVREGLIVQQGAWVLYAVQVC